MTFNYFKTILLPWCLVTSTLSVLPALSFFLYNINFQILSRVFPRSTHFNIFTAMWIMLLKWWKIISILAQTSEMVHFLLKINKLAWLIQFHTMVLRVISVCQRDSLLWFSNRINHHMFVAIYILGAFICRHHANPDGSHCSRMLLNKSQVFWWKNFIKLN
jgi:hypothetical protein